MLERLQVRDFRCFTSLEVGFDSLTTVLVGRNGQGKTSIIEAVCVLLRLQSPRTSTRTDWVRLGGTTAMVQGVWRGQQMRCATSAKSRRLAVDGVVCGRSADYLAASGVLVWMDHADMNLLRSGAEHRRRFLDFTGSQMFGDYLPALRGYERALRGRNHVLKREAVVDWKQAEAFAAVMEDKALVLRRHRRELVERLMPSLVGFHREVSRAEDVVRIGYEPGFEGDSLVEQLAAQRAVEQRQRTTVCGVHRDDFGWRLNDRDARTFASEGQQRTLALALRLSQATVLHEQRKQAPVILMDDVFGELDLYRREALMACLPKETQKILTTTHVTWAEAGTDMGRCLEIESGRVVDHVRGGGP